MTTTAPSLLRLCALAAGFALAVFTAGCHGTAYPVSTSWPLAGTVWKLVSLQNEAVAASHLPSLVFASENGRVHGRAGVNSLSGTYALAGPALSFGPLAVTKMAGEPRQMQLEQNFLAALARVSTWKIEGNLLILTDGTNELARFQGLPVGSPL